MTILGRFSVTSFALAAALFAGSSALAGDDCCKGDQSAAEPAGCCGAAAAGKCDLAECDGKLAAQHDGIMAKVTAPAPVLSPADAKAVAEAKQTLMTCPAGRAFTSVTPTLVEAVDALRALDEAVGKTNGLPESCRTKEGNCAFCAEAGKDMPEEGKKAMGISMKAIERAQKLAHALAPIAATFPLKGETTKPAGFALEAAGFEALAKKVDAATKEIAAGLEAAAKLPQAEREKIQAAMAVLDKLVPSHSPSTLAPAHMALYQELALANDAAQTTLKVFPKLADDKLAASLSANAQNARKLFLGRAQLLGSLGGMAAVTKPKQCESEGASMKPVSEAPGCCGEPEGQKKGTTAKPSN